MSTQMSEEVLSGQRNLLCKCTRRRVSVFMKEPGAGAAGGMRNWLIPCFTRSYGLDDTKRVVMLSE